MNKVIHLSARKPWVIVWVALAVVTVWTSPATARDRLKIYNERGEYRGYIAPNPYNDLCCDIYDTKGRRKGAIRGTRDFPAHGRDLDREDQHDRYKSWEKKRPYQD